MNYDKYWEEFYMSDIKYKRVLLKLSGEALAGDQGKGINPPEILKVAEEIKEVRCTNCYRRRWRKYVAW